MQCGFKLHDTMIYQRRTPPRTHKRYEQEFDFMFVLVKGKIKTFNPLLCKRSLIRPNLHNKAKGFRREKDGSVDMGVYKQNSDMVLRGNIWRYPSGRYATKDKIAFQHPAIFSEALAQDHILSWSNEGDIVLDCFCGSGTTPKMAKILTRHYIGIDTSAEYVALANERLAQVERGLTPREPDSLKAGDSCLPDVVQSESNLPA